MSGCEKSNVCASFVARGKSPLKLAIYISCAIAIGAVAGTLDYSVVDTIISGKWLTAPLEATQQRNTAAVAALETRVDSLVKDIDFVASRVNVSMRRNEDQSVDRFAALDAEIAALKDKLASVEAMRTTPVRADALLGGSDNAVVGLRSSLNDLTNSHHGAVAAITKRLDRIETLVGLSTDTKPVASPLERQPHRKSAKTSKKQKASPATPVADETVEQGFGQPERGHMFNVKPISQQTEPLRMSRLTH